jgi:predicted phage baseplate assembly protein
MEADMPLTAPNLDDRRFQDLVDEAKKRIPHYCKEWTDHNVSDPGVTLIELFAWMNDMLLYRLNQVPDLHYIRFMEMLGITLQEPLPAKTTVSFWLTKPQESVALIPIGTEVASTQTETEPSIIFTTDTDFRIHPPQWTHIISEISGEDRTKHFVPQNIKRSQAGFEGFDVFSRIPIVDDALYFGFNNDLSNHILGFEMDCDPAGGTGIDPTLPPYLWEASTGQTKETWIACESDSDTTKGMNSPGKIYIHLPQMGKNEVNGNELFWVRVRIKEITPTERREGMHPYRLTPKIRKLAVASWGGSVPATHAQLVVRELLGRSDGSPGQRFHLQIHPILKRLPGETIVMDIEGESPQTWIEVHDFADSAAEDRHFTLDGVTGDIRFGPAIRLPDGTIKLYGAIPPRGANIYFGRYHHGGGQKGNVESGILNTLKTAIPYIARVLNRKPAFGGLDDETLEAAMVRVPALLRSRERAVTEADYEFLAHQALPGAIGRVKCLQPRSSDTGRVAGRVDPSLVYVLVIPRVPHPSGRLYPEQLKISPEHKAILSAYLDDRRLLTTRLEVRDPAYYWVSVEVQVHAASSELQTKVEANVLARLYSFINPLTGGTEGEGWPFGRSIYISNIHQCLQGIPDVMHISKVEMFPVQDGKRGNAVESIELVAHGVVASAIHHITFV